jgi:N-acetylglucosamine PTS system EIICBA or EIICB component
MKNFFGALQKIGKALMLPIAVLPVAALLLRFGQADLLNIEAVANAGSSILDNLPLIFAIGVAIGVAKDQNGAAALSGAVGYLIIQATYTSINSDINMGVLSGILAGYLAGVYYNRFHNIKLPKFLGFFGGKRFIPIITGITTLVIGVALGYIWPPIQDVISKFGEWLIGAGALGVGVYGTFNSLLLPFGLHHILNSMVWFVFGDFTNAAGELVQGDLFRFFAGDPTAGQFMAGFYPIFMFAMPALALAMYHSAKPENRSEVGGVLFSAALTFALTGIGEPLLFSFVFIAPALYGVHALLQGSSMAITYLLGIRHGFGFSAGLIDYVLNWKFATKPALIIPLGIVYALIYYFLFRFLIKKFNIMTPGREDFGSDEAVQLVDIPDDEKAIKFIEYLGGKDNFSNCEACITRLRLTVQDVSKVDEAKLKSLGAVGVLKVKNSIQVVVGTEAEFIADSINTQLSKMD